uniref:TLDc domain-containing protein n=1 Tax=Callorhinchus milii TaxID=7868 RepID=A0A4W3IH82_CALMI
METKDVKKERSPGYLARLKKKTKLKPKEQPVVCCTENPSPRIRVQTSEDCAEENLDISLRLVKNKDSPAHSKTSSANGDTAVKDIKKPFGKVTRHAGPKKYYFTVANHDKEKKATSGKLLGALEYEVDYRDTITNIALNFNTTPTEIVYNNKLFSCTVIPGQILYVPDICSPDFGRPVTPSSSDAKYKLPNADLARTTTEKNFHSPPLRLHPILRVMSSGSEEDEPPIVKFLKMNCRYITDGKGVVGGVMIVTPNNIMFDPHKSDPLVIENGCEEYGLLCPMEEIISIALYNDISHMKIKDALPSDVPKDLSPLYRPEDWDDLSAEKDLNPFNRFKAMSKNRHLRVDDNFENCSDHKDVGDAADEGFTELAPSPVKDKNATVSTTNSVSTDLAHHIPLKANATESAPEKHGYYKCGSTTVISEEELIGTSDKQCTIEIASDDSKSVQNENACNIANISSVKIDGSNLESDLNNLSEVPPVQVACSTDLKPHKESLKSTTEERSKKPPMFMCIKVGKPMLKSFAGDTAARMQQYVEKGKQPEYWFAVPQERVDHLYAFFVQWSPDLYGKDAKDHGFVVVNKDELEVIDDFFSAPIPKSWEIITIKEAKRRQSVGSFYEEEAEDLQPVLTDVSDLLERLHIEKLAQCLPARTQGYAWQLMYSTAVHGTSLRTMYRCLAAVDSPVLLVVKDMDNQVFGALASHPFRLSDHCFGTGETFLYTFNPEFKVNFASWIGENSYFIKGDRDSLELGGGDGHFGLWLDADLYRGRSNPCNTFNNEILSRKEDFIVQTIEVWTFV